VVSASVVGGFGGSVAAPWSRLVVSAPAVVATDVSDDAVVLAPCVVADCSASPT